MTYPKLTLIFFFGFIIAMTGCSSEDSDPVQPIPFTPAEPEPPNNFGVEVLSNTERVDGTSSDITGYVDPTSGTEYAILGDLSGLQLGAVHIYEVRSDGTTRLVSSIHGVDGFDVKVWDHYLYIANGGPFGGAPNERSVIYDIENPSRPTKVGEFAPTHNVTIDPRGYLILSATHEADGLLVMDLNRTPQSPNRVWSDRFRTAGHDASVIGNRMYDFHASFTAIYDFTDPENPIELSIIRDDNISYHHSGWTTEDGNYLFICDEGGDAYFVQPDVTIWSIADPTAPTKVGEIHDPNSRVHNLYIEDNLAYISYYEAGFRVYDLARPYQPELVAQYHTNASYGSGVGGGFTGAFGIHLATQSDFIYISDINNGLYVVRLDL